jgi:hypothetical protein
MFIIDTDIYKDFFAEIAFLQSTLHYSAFVNKFWNYIVVFVFMNT